MQHKSKMNEKIYKLLHDDSSGKQRFLGEKKKPKVSLFVSEMEAIEEYNEFFVKNNS